MQAYIIKKRLLNWNLRNIAFKEYLLSYNSLPDEVLSDEEALEIRKQILKVNPENKTVKQHFSAQRFVGKLD